MVNAFLAIFLSLLLSTLNLCPTESVRVCVCQRQKERANSRHLLVIVVFWISPPSFISTSPSLLSTLFLLSPSCCLFPVTGEVAAPCDPWPPAGHLGRYVGRWGLCWRAARTLRKPVLIRWRKTGGRSYCLLLCLQMVGGNGLDYSSPSQNKCWLHLNTFV